jgi:hypothetical protein
MAPNWIDGPTLQHKEEEVEVVVVVVKAN